LTRKKPLPYNITRQFTVEMVACTAIYGELHEN
jgi:hypothetical protein